jgi:hypothetical protein
MRIANLIRLALLGLTLCLIGASAASASPLGSSVSSIAGTSNIQRVNDYYSGYGSGYGYRDCLRPSHRHYSSDYYGRDYYRPRYRDYGYRDYGYSGYRSYSYSRRPYYRGYSDYDY